MSDELEQLKQQRALIEQHLHWLDAQIQAQQVQTPPTTPPEPPHSETKDPTTLPALPEPSPEKSTPPAAAAPYTLPEQPQVKNQVLGARIGCGLLFIAGIALVLFLLFGLPSLIYKDNPSPENNSSQQPATSN